MEEKLNEFNSSYSLNNNKFNKYKECTLSIDKKLSTNTINFSNRSTNEFDPKEFQTLLKAPILKKKTINFDEYEDLDSSHMEIIDEEDYSPKNSNQDKTISEEVVITEDNQYNNNNNNNNNNTNPNNNLLINISLLLNNFEHFFDNNSNYIVNNNSNSSFSIKNPFWLSVINKSQSNNNYLYNKNFYYSYLENYQYSNNKSYNKNINLLR